jgi:hypothetical protein
VHLGLLGLVELHVDVDLIVREARLRVDDAALADQEGVPVFAAGTDLEAVVRVRGDHRDGERGVVRFQVVVVAAVALRVATVLEPVAIVVGVVAARLLGRTLRAAIGAGRVGGWRRAGILRDLEISRVRDVAVLGHRVDLEGDAGAVGQRRIDTEVAARQERVDRALLGVDVLDDDPAGPISAAADGDGGERGAIGRAGLGLLQVVVAGVRIRLVVFRRIDFAARGQDQDQNRRDTA